jgi:hypothetical protein
MEADSQLRCLHRSYCIYYGILAINSLRGEACVMEAGIKREPENYLFPPQRPLLPRFLSPWMQALREAPPANSESWDFMIDERLTRGA